jgi:hypothetical protein
MLAACGYMKEVPRQDGKTDDENTLDQRDE